MSIESEYRKTHKKSGDLTQEPADDDGGSLHDYATALERTIENIDSQTEAILKQFGIQLD